jgi:hypothetical protein
MDVFDDDLGLAAFTSRTKVVSVRLIPRLGYPAKVSTEFPVSSSWGCHDTHHSIFKTFRDQTLQSSRLRSPFPRVRKPPRVVASSDGGNTSLSLKPEARNSLELINIVTGGRDLITRGR